MGKKKDPMALFEILSQQDNPGSATKVPEWMRRKAAEQADEPAPAPLETDGAAEETTPDGKCGPDEAAEDVAIVASEGDLPEEVAPAEPDTEDDDRDEPVDEGQADGIVDDEVDEETAAEADEETQYDVDAPANDDLEADEPVEVGPVAAEEPAEENRPEAPPELTPHEQEFVGAYARELTGVPEQKETTPPPASAGRSEPWLSIAGQRVSISLSVLKAMVAIGVVMILLVLMFLLGRLTAPKTFAPAEPADAGQAEIPALPPIEGLRPMSPTTEPVKATQTGQRDPRRQYLVIQTLSGTDDEDLAEAERIMQFAARHDLPADIQIMGTGDNRRYVVWSLLGVADRDSDAAAEHVRKVERVGKAYFETYGTYDFRQQRQGRAQPFWVSGKVERK
ncbi:MAG: hypothetical protein GVY16_03485 [Planctomycetes bacterium]|nr:hypothetical protein [Phycisphaerae bacterium]NBB94782.1 hypothetical protein [Planctomycetota bacterium]